MGFLLKFVGIFVVVLIASVMLIVKIMSERE